MGGIERGEHNLALVNIMKIVRALEVLPSEFFGDLDDVSVVNPAPGRRVSR